jgi:HEAT repeat protein
VLNQNAQQIASQVDRRDAASDHVVGESVNLTGVARLMAIAAVGMPMLFADVSGSIVCAEERLPVVSPATSGRTQRQPSTKPRRLPRLQDILRAVKPKPTVTEATSRRPPAAYRRRPQQNRPTIPGTIPTYRMFPLRPGINTAKPGANTAKPGANTAMPPEIALDPARRDSAKVSKRPTAPPVIKQSPPPLAEEIAKTKPPEPKSAVDLKIDELLKRLDSPDVEVRRTAATELGWNGPKAKRSLPALYQGLNDESPVVRIAVTAAIWQIAHQPGTVVPVLVELLQAGDPTVRTLAAHALGTIGTEAKRGLPDLHRVLETSSGLFQVNVAEAIVQIDSSDAPAFDALVAALKDPTADVRCQAAYALSAAADTRSKEIIHALSPLRKDVDPRVQEAAKLTVDQLKRTAFAVKQEKREARTDKLMRLVKLMQSDDAAERKDGAARLAWLGADARPVLPLIERRLNDESAVVRATAAWAVWEVGQRSSTAIKTLVPLLDEKDENLATLAAYVLGSMKSHALPALGALRREMAASDGMLRLHLAEAIAKIDPTDKPAVNVLTAALDDANPDVRSQAAFALSATDVQQVARVIPHLAFRLEDDEEMVRSAARLTLAGYLDSTEPGVTGLTAYVLGTQGKEAAPLLPELHSHLQQSDGFDRLQLAEAITRIDPTDQSAGDILLAAFDDSSPEVRSQAAFALSSVDVRWVGRVIPRLASSLNDDDESVRTAARLTLEGYLQTKKPGLLSVTAYMLGRIVPNADPLLPELRRLLKTRRGIDQLQVAEAITRIDPSDIAAVDVMTAALSDTDSSIRSQAAFALGSVSARHIGRVKRPLSHAIEDRDEQVRQAARLTLSGLRIDPATVSPRLAQTTRSTPPQQDDSPRRVAGSKSGMSEPKTTQALPFPPRLPVQPEPVASTKKKPATQSTPAVVWVRNNSIVDAPVPPTPLHPTVSQSVASATSQPRLLPLDLDKREDEVIRRTRVAMLQPVPNTDNEAPPSTPDRTRLGIFDISGQSLLNYSNAIPYDDEGMRQPMPEDDPRTANAFRAARIAAGYEDETIRQSMGTGRGWMSYSYYWEAAALSHRPVYFEETNLERYGNSFGLVQPVVSAAHFFGTMPLLPYIAVVNPPQKATYTLGHYRPGSDIPFRYHRLPIRLNGALVEAATIWGLVLLMH